MTDPAVDEGEELESLELEGLELEGLDLEEGEFEEETGGVIPLSDPDMTQAELDAVDAVLRTSRLSNGPVVEKFEAAFREYLGRKYAIAVPSGTIGLMLTLVGMGIGPGDEVICTPYSFREVQHAIDLAGAKPVFVDIDYWAGTIVPEKAKKAITEKTKAILGSNNNGHPAPWPALREIVKGTRIALIEDCTESIGSKLQDQVVGTFGDASIFDFAQPSMLTCGEGGMIVTDDIDIAVAARRFRSHRMDEMNSLVVTSAPSMQAQMSDVSAALGLTQLNRLEEIIEKRRLIEHYYFKHVASFEGIKDPYVAPEVTEAHWFLYVVHLGTRFSKSSRDAIVEDLRVEDVEAQAYCTTPLHLQRRYFEHGYRKGGFLVTEKVADRAVALPFHTHLSEDQIEFIVATMKDASVNIGAGSAIYL
jgi:dTDP-4-amino-4,6-dideoxygalactose transaminase